MNYGITYQGSKSGIAENIIDLLPAGNRFVDLFGGGTPAQVKRVLEAMLNE